MSQDQLKQMAAQAALSYIPRHSIVGIGTGSTVNFLIAALATNKVPLEGAVASSVASAERLKKAGIPVVELNTVGELPIYIDGADEFNQHHYLVKGGGGALTREKILATAAKQFVCIADASKQVGLLGAEFPVAVEVIPMARSFVARQIVKLGGDPVYREKFVTDNGNVILDVYNLKLLNPVEMEQKLNNIPGVVANGIFALRPADVILVANANGVATL